MWHCPFNCEKYQIALEAAEELHNRQKELQKRCSELERNNEIINALCGLLEKGYQILGIEESNGSIFAVVMVARPKFSNFTAYDRNTIYMFNLPKIDAANSCGKMYIKYHSSCRAELIDWFVLTPNRGYGSILLKHVIFYLRNAGFQYVCGVINPTDFDHVDLLLHLYEKFGFQIKKLADHYSLHLDLLDKTVFPIHVQSNEGGSYLVCSRDPMHDIACLEQKCPEVPQK